MKSFYSFIVIFILGLINITTHAEVKVNILSLELGENIPDANDNGREYFNISYDMEVTGAKGHILRPEITLENAKGVKIENTSGEPVYNSTEHEIFSDKDSIQAWVGYYYDVVALKPGVHTVTAKFKIFDETSGRYIQIPDTKSFTFQLKSTQPSPGIRMNSMYVEHGKWYNNTKGMYVYYDYSANWYKDKDIKVVVQLYKSNGTPIYQKNGKLDNYTTTIKPAYNFARYDGQWTFFYYNTIKLPAGRTNCYVQVKFIDTATGKELPVTGNRKVSFDFTR